jgi:DNA N-6-adenine-methyltransferase (Dam)
LENVIVGTALSKTVAGTLVNYTAACKALAAARSTDEVRKIRDSAAALATYARLAKNRSMEIDAAEIRIRAERRVGELIAAQKQTSGLSKGTAGTGNTNIARKTGGSKSDPPVKDGRATLADAGIDKHLADRARKLAAAPPPKFETMIGDWRDRAVDGEQRIAGDLFRPARSVHHSSETPEHYTPQSFLVAVHAVFGGIPDLDPCSNSHDRPNVEARKHYTAADDGLAQPWSGRVFLNPPYGRDISQWIEKLRAEWSRGEVSEAIALLPSRTDTEWFDTLTKGTDDAVICFLDRRLTFVGNSDPAPFPSMAVYFGPRHDVFARVFLDMGSLWQRPGSPLEWFVSHE